MSVNFRNLIDFIVATGGQVPIYYIDAGNIIVPFKSSGFIGGKLSKVFADNLGRLHVMNVTMSSILGCGHHVSSAEQIRGFCQVCGRICCTSQGCLRKCDLTGITVCSRHYTVKDRIVVSSLAQKGLGWRLKVRKIASKRKALADERKQLEKK